MNATMTTLMTTCKELAAIHGNKSHFRFITRPVKSETQLNTHKTSAQNFKALTGANAGKSSTYFISSKKKMAKKSIRFSLFFLQFFRLSV